MRVELSGQLLRTLGGLSHRGLVDVITADESWFLYDNPHTRMWAAEKEDVPHRESPKIGSSKAMITVFWGLRGLLYIEALPKGVSYDSSYICDTLLPNLEKEVRKTRPVLGLSGMRLNWDNARPHASISTTQKLRDLKVHILGHPPYSPDLAPSDFFLFGFLKNLASGHCFSDRNELVAFLEFQMRNIQKSTFEKVFNEWMGRLEWVVEHDGEYYIE